MSSNLPFLCIIILFIIIIPFSRSQSPSRGTFIDCGSLIPTTDPTTGILWQPDTAYITSGTSKTLAIKVTTPILSTVRSFPNNVNRKFCYVFPVYRSGRYLLRTTYFYGGVNAGRDVPPVFDQVVDGTVWGLVNTTEDYLAGNAAYYEGVFEATGNTMSVCVAPNSLTDSDPFISALEFVMLEGSLYNSTDFAISGLRLVARNSFGYAGSTIR